MKKDLIVTLVIVIVAAFILICEMIVCLKTVGVIKMDEKYHLTKKENREIKEQNTILVKENIELRNKLVRCEGKKLRY